MKIVNSVFPPNTYSDFFLSLIRIGLQHDPESSIPDITLSQDKWREFYKKAALHAISAVVFESVKLLPADNKPDKKLYIQWFVNSENIHKQYDRQHLAVVEFTNILSEQNIKITLLKGLGLASLYPTPWQRQCGDIDIFIHSDNNTINPILEKAGIKVEYFNTKESHIRYMGIQFDNHYSFVFDNGSRRNALLNQILLGLIEDSSQYYENTDIQIPPPLFNALFLTEHAFHHYLESGISLRHICDWGYFVKANENNIDWEKFYTICRKFKMEKFAHLMTSSAVQYLGFTIEYPAIIKDHPLTENFFYDILNQKSLGINYEKGIKRAFISTSRVIRHRWRYNHILGTNFIAYIIHSGLLKIKQQFLVNL